MLKWVETKLNNVEMRDTCQSKKKKNERHKILINYQCKAGECNYAKDVGIHYSHSS